MLLEGSMGHYEAFTISQRF